MRKEWTEQEEKYMKRYYLHQPSEMTAKKLNRSIYSIRRKAAKMGLNHYTDQLSAKTLAKCFNCDVSVILRWIQKYGLPARKVVCKTQTRYSVSPNDFWQWAENNKNLINWARYEAKSILPEPEWVREEIRNYKTPMSRKKYTEEEKEKIRVLLKKGMNYKQISEEIGRSYYSVVHAGRSIYT